MAQRNAPWWDWVPASALNELGESFDRQGTGPETENERVQIIDQWKAKYEPPTDVVVKAKALLNETNMSTLRRRIALRLEKGLGVYHRIGNRFDPLLVALRLGIELAADGEMMRAVGGSIGVLKFLQMVDCWDAFSPRNRKLLSEMLEQYRRMEVAYRFLPELI